MTDPTATDGHARHPLWQPWEYARSYFDLTHSTKELMCKFEILLVEPIIYWFPERAPMSTYAGLNGWEMCGVAEAVTREKSTIHDVQQLYFKRLAPRAQT